MTWHSIELPSPAKIPTGFKRLLRGALRKSGFELISSEEFRIYRDMPPDFDDDAVDVINRVKPFTMTTRERLYALVDAVRYVVRSDIPGAIVECGVWRGGSMMAAALTLIKLRAQRSIVLYDTFEGMPAPTDDDRDAEGRAAADYLATEERATSHVWAYSELSEVRANMESTGYDPKLVRYVRGRVEDTIPVRAPDEIALLRLDTDWYESTIHELVHLFPRLAVGGILILDDYGHWKGARKAVDEYFRRQCPRIYLARIDAARVAVKLEEGKITE
jgi:hypothetical protein